MLQQHS